MLRSIASAAATQDGDLSARAACAVALSSALACAPGVVPSYLMQLGAQVPCQLQRVQSPMLQGAIYSGPCNLQLQYAKIHLAERQCFVTSDRTMKHIVDMSMRKPYKTIQFYHQCCQHI